MPPLLLPCGKSLSPLIRYRNNPSKSPLTFGVILALAAWLMQLSVFLTPIFAKQLRVGFGVCEELAVFSQFKTPAPHPFLSHTSVHDDMSSMSMANMPHMMMPNPDSAPSNYSQHHHSLESTTATASKVVTSSLLKPHVDPLHQHHAKCEFCLLLGHSVLPPLFVVMPVLLTIVIAKIIAKAKATDALFLNQNKNLRPQGRAPPLFIS